MALQKKSKIKVIRGPHKNKNGICKGFMGAHDILIEFENGELDVVCIIDVKEVK